MVIQRIPKPVYELTDLQSRPIGGQFYNYEFLKFTISPGSEFEIDKIVRSRNNGGRKQHLAKWKGYDNTFDSWVNTSDVKRL